MNAYSMRNQMNLINFDTEITRAEFEATFTKTKERVEFTFFGWDGKSYNGESRLAYVYRANVPGYEAVRFIKVGKGIHYIVEDDLRLNQLTGTMNPKASWLVNVERKAQ